MPVLLSLQSRTAAVFIFSALSRLRLQAGIWYTAYGDGPVPGAAGLLWNYLCRVQGSGGVQSGNYSGIHGKACSQDAGGERMRPAWRVTMYVRVRLDALFRPAFRQWIRASFSGRRSR